MEYIQHVALLLRTCYPPVADQMTYLVGFPLFWKMIIDMTRLGSGYEFTLEMIPQATDLHKTSLGSVVDISILPKAIGGEAFTVDDESGEEDEHCSRGRRCPKLSRLLRECAGLEDRRSGSWTSRAGSAALSSKGNSDLKGNPDLKGNSDLKNNPGYEVLGFQ